MSKRMKTETPSPAATAAAPDDAYVPDFATTVRGSTLPALDPQPPFVLTYSSRRWTIIDGRLVPALGRFPLVAGVNNVSVGRDGRIHFAAARARLEERNKRMVPMEWAPNGTSYVRKVQTRPAGRRDSMDTYITVFERVLPGDPNTYSNAAAYADWLAGLVDSGKLPPCPPDLVMAMLDRARAEFTETQALADKHKGEGSLLVALDACKRKVAALEAAAKNLPEVDGESVVPEMEG